ncbi:MAG: XdhC family protein [Myxococcota bacterium]|nr:XdhC family protein [Myxococcota bacterium]
MTYPPPSAVPEPLARLIIFGAGHVGTDLANLAADVGYAVIIVDARSEWIDESRFRSTVTALDMEPETFVRQHTIEADDYVVVMTHSHPLDDVLIRHLIPLDLPFLGMIGSRGKWARFRKRYEARGLDMSLVDQVVCPVGLDIGGQTPMEIAISVCAQLTQLARQGPKWSNDAANPSKVIGQNTV